MPLKWKNPTGRGVMYVRGGWLWGSIAGDRSTLEIRWPADDGTRKRVYAGESMTAAQRTAYDDGMKELQGRVTGQRDAPALAAHGPMTLYRALKAYKRDFLVHKPERYQARAEAAFRAFLLDKEHGDFVLTSENIRARIAEMRAGSDLELSTLRGLWYKLGAFIRYAIGCEWLPSNLLPFLTDAKPKEEVIVGGDPLPPVAIGRILVALRERGNEWHVLHVKLLALTGMRQGESLKLRWRDVSATAITIYGKRVRGHKVMRSSEGERTGVVRVVPLHDAHGGEAIPGLLSVLAELARMHSERPKKGHDDDWLFPYRSIPALYAAFRDSSERAGRPATLHQLRDSAGWWFREYLGWEVPTICSVLGQSLQTHARHYYKERQEAEVRRSIGGVYKNSTGPQKTPESV